MFLFHGGDSQLLGHTLHVDTVRNTHRRTGLNPLHLVWPSLIGRKHQYQPFCAISVGLILAQALSQGADGGRGRFEPSHRPPGDRLASPGLSASPENEGTGCPPRSSSSRIHFRGWFWGVRYAAGSGFSPRISFLQQIGPIKSTLTGRGRRACYLVFNIIKDSKMWQYS